MKHILNVKCVQLLYTNIEMHVNANIFNSAIIIVHYTNAVQLGYEPAGLTVHPPPNDRGWVHFFRMGV